MSHRVLIVEDDYATQELLAALLERESIESDHARFAPAANGSPYGRDHGRGRFDLGRPGETAAGTLRATETLDIAEVVAQVRACMAATAYRRA